MTQINIIYLPPNPGVHAVEKFMDRAFKVANMAPLRTVVVFAVFIPYFNILPKVLYPKCHTILESIFDAYEGGKVKNSTFRSF